MNNTKFFFPKTIIGAQSAVNIPKHKSFLFVTTPSAVMTFGIFLLRILPCLNVFDLSKISFLLLQNFVFTISLFFITFLDFPLH